MATVLKPHQICKKAGLKSLAELSEKAEFQFKL